MNSDWSIPQSFIESHTVKDKMPVVFIGHGNPMYAINDNSFSRNWEKLGEILPRPKVIVVVSAHWLTYGSWVTGMDAPPTIHDFSGFPKEMYDIIYPSPGAPGMALRIKEMFPEGEVNIDLNDWGLDHGAWSVLKRVFPQADIPVIQFSLDVNKTPSDHFNLGKMLGKLRDEGVLMVCSGNLVHNLEQLDFSGNKFGWAMEFDRWLSSAISERNLESILSWKDKGKIAELAVPTDEHFLPVLYALGAMEEEEKVFYFNDDFDMGSVSMRSFISIK